MAIFEKTSTMGLLTPKGKKGDKKNNGPKNSGPQSKFISKGNTKGVGGNAGKKGMTGGSQRGS